MKRRLPWYAWLGLAAIVGSEIGMLAEVEPFWSWHTPIAWTGYILLVDGLVWRRRGNSLLRNSPAEALFLAVLSVPLWVIFEQYNKYFLHNWYYLGLPHDPVVRDIGYFWAFATIWPAIFETGELIGTLRRRGRAKGLRDTGTDGLPADEQTAAPRRIPLGAWGWLSVGIGTLFVLLPILFPSPWLAAPLWLGFIFLLDPINASLGAESLRGDFRSGRRDRLFNLLIGGLLCGVIWECWNYWARSKWIYNVPVPPHIKLFEMPLAGYGGFLPFALECFTMYVFVRHFVWRRAFRPVAL